MKLITSFIILLFPIFSYANEIQVISAQIGCTEKNTNTYTYKALLVLKNISKDKITLITKSSGFVTIPKYGDTPTEVVITHSERAINDVPIIPTSEQLGMVTLHPGEGAEIHHEFSSASYITSAIIQYNATAIYNNRFNNWVGSAKSSEVNTLVLKACKP